ncbi:unnamed protein product [Adineta ricciae]|uniref:Uncharacterized protein n=1 Tax=Adineta ricciae TaxID=249248 RepID=A0A815MXF5_ADIRI|nr:unnamed protein product [Adineta ricciae]CAF1430493.1 unnamed protein product [Adineta ricciae]
MQAIRLNSLENRRLQIQIKAMREDLQTYLTRLHREEQGLKYHFKNVVRVIKPNPAYQRWKQAHMQEIAQEETKDLIESIKMRARINSISGERSTSSSSNKAPTEPVRPMLLLVDHDDEKHNDSNNGKSKHLLRPRTTPVQKRSTTQSRTNPLIALLDGYPSNSNPACQSQSPPYLFDSPSFNSSIGTMGSRRLFPSKLLDQQKSANIDVVYRIALQNQIAFKEIDQKVIEERKLQDRDFALQHRALKGSIRMARLINKIN